MGTSFGRTTGTRTTGAGTADDTRPAGDLPAGTVPAPRPAPARVGIPQQRTSASLPGPTEPPAGPSANGVQYCRCGHDAGAHEHFRAGSECATCDCSRYRTTGGFAALLAFTTRRGR